MPELSSASLGLSLPAGWSSPSSKLEASLGRKKGKEDFKKQNYLYWTFFTWEISGSPFSDPLELLLSSLKIKQSNIKRRSYVNLNGIQIMSQCFKICFRQFHFSLFWFHSFGWNFYCHSTNIVQRSYFSCSLHSPLYLVVFVNIF